MANVNATGNPNWVPGVSGNPRGRPPKPYPEYQKTAREAATEAILMFVRAMREADDWDTRIRAGNSILDRAYGKPLQQTDVTTNGEISVAIKMLLGAQVPQQQAAIDVTNQPDELPDAGD